MHSTTYRRQLKKYQAEQALEQRVKASIAYEDKLRDHYTDEDRKVAEELEARDLLRALEHEEF